MPKIPRQTQRLVVYISVIVTLFFLYSKVFSSSSEAIYSYDFTDYVVQDIRLKSCNRFFGACGPPSSNRKKGIKLSSIWVRIPKDLALNEKFFKRTYIYKEMIPASEALLADVDIVLDIAIKNEALDKQIPTNKGRFPFEIIREFYPLLKAPASSDSHLKIPSSESVKKAGWRNKGNGVWVRMGKHVKEKTVGDITILFGRDCVDPRPQWEIIPVPLPTIGAASSAADMGKYSKKDGNHSHDKEVYISFKRFQNSVPTPKPVLRAKTDGSFKILQVADLHFSTGYGYCRDTFPELEGGEECLADPRTLAFVNKVLDIEKPDLVVLTGDQIFGDESPDSETTMYKVVEPFIKRRIPYAMTFGNHDDEGSLTRSQLVELIKDLPYSLTTAGPSKVTGVGNYILTVMSADNEKEAVSVLYFLDSHKYSPSPKTNPGYDWMKEDQIEYVQEYSSSMGTSKKKLSMAFFHIPLTEYKEIQNTKGDYNKVVGNIKEGVTAPSYNTFMKDALVEAGVSVVTVGHDHCNDYCMLNEDGSDGIWLCYGGASGEGGYAGYGGTTRRLRTFVLNTNKKSIQTWKRLETEPDIIFDEQKLV